MEWLHRYYMMSKKKKFDIFMHVLIDAMKKESSTAGPFLLRYLVNQDLLRKDTK